MLISYIYFTGDNIIKDNYNVNKVILVSGKHYYALNNYREITGNKNVAIIRIESLCPFPTYELLEEIKKYKYATSKRNLIILTEIYIYIYIYIYIFIYI